MIGFLSFIFSLGLGFGISCWIYGTLLEKSNNLGDSKGDRRDYGIAVLFTARKDRLSGSEKNSFSATYARRIDDQEVNPSGSEMVRRLSQEEIDSYQAQAETAQRAVQTEIPNTGMKDAEDEFREWENSIDQNTQAPSAFKPYDPGN